MNYLVLNDNEFFNGIQLSNFKEVQIDDRNRTDIIFGTITPKLLESAYNDDGRGNKILREKWISRN